MTAAKRRRIRTTETIMATKRVKKLEQQVRQAEAKVEAAKVAAIATLLRREESAP